MNSPNFTNLSRRSLLQMFSLLGLTALARGTHAAPALRSNDSGGVRRFLIDTDTASDDAVALVMALRNPGVSVEAITVVAGNMPIEKGLQNALYTRDLCQSHAPVYRGSAAPLLRPLHTAEYVHGNDGFGDIGLPLTGRTPAPGHAVPAIIDVINRHAGDITLVTLGPLTNIALALKLDPSIAQKVTRCVIMGGVGFGGVGNVTPVAEYNIWVDPEAAKIVFESGLPIEMVGWDISVASAVFDPQETARLRDIGTPLAKFCVDIQKSLTQFALKRTKLAGFDLPDPIAMAVAIDPTIATKTERRYVQVDTQSDLTLGQTVVDQLGVTGKPANTTVVKEASRERFIQLLHDSVRA
jgi:purine nucleosidase